MPTFSGSKVYDGVEWMYAELEVSLDPASPTAADDEVEATTHLYGWFRYAVVDSSNTCAISGDLGATSGAASISTTNSGPTRVLLKTVVQDVSLTYGATQNKNVGGSISGIEAIPGTATVAGVVTIPARPYQLPAAPTSVAVARVSDTQHTLTWTNTSPGSSSAPYAGVRVQRRVDGGAWATIANLGVETTFTDSTTTADNLYEYRVAGTNSSGVGAYTESNDIQTSPTAPTAAVAAKDVSGNIVIDWTNTTTLTAYETEVEHSADGGAWSLLTTKSAGVATHTHASPNPAQTHRYRVRAKSSTGATTYSGYSTSGIVTLASVPDAPQSLAPNGIAADATEDQDLTWVHVPTDSSPQSKFQVRHRVVGAGSWTTESEVTSGVSSWQLADGEYSNGADVEWQVKTWGAHATGSAWSASATITFRARPTATIASPTDAEVLGTSTAELTWGYYQEQSQPQTAWRATLLDAADETIEVKTGSGAATSTTFATALADAATYTMRLELQASSGLWSAADEVEVTVAYLPPADVNLTPTYDVESGAMVLSLGSTAPVDDVSVAAVAVTVERSIDGGPWEIVNSEAVGPDAVLIDALPTIAGVNAYRAIVTSALPSTAVMDPVELTTAERRRCFLNAGTGFADIVSFWVNPKFETRTGRVKSLHAAEGRTLPLQLTGDQVTDSLGVSGLLADGSSIPVEVRALAQTRTIVAWRDPSGRRLFGSLSDVAISEDTPEPGTHGVGFSIVETARA